MGHLELEHEPWMHIIGAHQGEPQTTSSSPLNMRYSTSYLTNEPNAFKWLYRSFPILQSKPSMLYFAYTL